MYKHKISKDEVNQMPTILFEGKITLIDDISQVKEAIDKLSESKIVGIDTETKPSFTRGLHNRVSLIQISTLEDCYLFRLNRINLPKELIDLLTNEKIQKIGLALRDDFTGLNKFSHFKPANFVDLQTIVNQYGIMELGLQKIFAIVFGHKISKSQRLTNWEIQELTEQQQRYAATDAWASLLIHEQLKRESILTKKEIDKIKADLIAEEILSRETINSIE